MSNGKATLPLINQVRRSVSMVGFVGLAICAIAYLFFGGFREQVFQAYLYGWIFWVCVSLGCFGFTLLHHCFRAAWGRAVLRILEAGSSTLPWMGILFLPVLIGIWLGEGGWGHHLYPWAHYQKGSGDTILDHKSLYLNEWGFTLRFLFYFVVWIALSRYLNRLSLEQDRTGDTRLAVVRTSWSAPGFVIFGLTVTFAFTDWVMSLDPHWYSTIFGLYFVVAQGLAAISLCGLLAAWLSDRRPFSEVVTPGLTRDLGNLMLTLTMLWAYVCLSQFLIMYSANLPEEVIYYQTRLSGGWWFMGTILVLFQFFAPFLMLLSGRTKRTPGLLFRVAVLILTMRALDLAWIIFPFFFMPGHSVPGEAGGMSAGGGLSLFWLAPAAFLGIGGLWLTLFYGRLRRHPLLAVHAPQVREVLEHA